MKMYSAFAGVTSFPLKRIIFQFWRPQIDHGRLVLQCLRNPYAVSTYNLRLGKYRSCCTKYRYSVVEGDSSDNPPPWFISGGGPVVSAFLNHFPEVVLDLRVLQGSDPLVDRGLECDLMCCVMLPVFHVGSSDCVGVVECSMKHPTLLLPMFNELKCELEEAIPGDLEPAKTEIENGLKIACESHDLTLAQVWISYESDHHALDMTKRMFLVKMSGYSVDSNDDPLSSVKDFYDKLDVIYLKTGNGLAQKTLQTHQPHLCRNIYKLSDNSGVLALLSASTKSKKCASFVICLRSTDTRELDYAFEFFWPQSRHHLILLDALLATLRKHLPSFKFASGEQLGDELSVVDVDGYSSRLVKVLLGNENELSEASNETRTSVGVKRKSIAGQSDLNHPEGEDDDLAILASYRSKPLLFYIPSSSTFEYVLEKLNKEFELDPARTYKVEYKVSPGHWSSLVCLESCRGMDLIKLRVLPEGREVGWRWKTDS
ncbi:hypothetical protein HanPI659440_Chr04g0146091 [Helianthus annuus]|nr:hypothetical protein HanPI659440_Chr04g0146091 [Helianthus annuus]